MIQPRSPRRLLLALAAALVLAACGREAVPADPATADAATRLHERLLTLDSHVDIPFTFATDEHDPATAEAQVNLDRMREGGLDAAFFIVYVGQEQRAPDSWARATRDALTKFEAIHRMTSTLYPDRIGLATSVDEVLRHHDEGRLVALIGVENGFTLGGELERLADFHARGARYMTLVHNGHNALADSAQPREDLGDSIQEHGGLSDFGRAVVAEMNRLGMLVDVSHASKRAMLEATRLSRAPVIASHSAAAAVTPHPRNLDDEQLRALADNGGVVQVVAFDSYVKAVPEARTEAVRQLREEMGVTGASALDGLDMETRLTFEQALAAIEERWPGADVEDFVDHIDHVVELIGIDHVGIASDFGGGGGVEGWSSAAESANVTAELLRRGYSEEDVAKLWSGNLLRVMDEAARIAEAG